MRKNIFVFTFVAVLGLTLGLSAEAAEAHNAGVIPKINLIKNHSSAGGAPRYKENDKDLIYKAKQGDKIEFSVTGGGADASSYKWKVMKGSKVLTTFTKGKTFTWAVPSEKSTWEIYVAAANSKGRDYISWSITTSGLKAVKPGESIQKAIDSLPPEGGIVELAAGIWTIDSTLKIVGSNVTLRGAGKDKTVIKGAKSMLLLLVRGPKATFPKLWGGRNYPKPPDPMFIEEITIKDLALTGEKLPGKKRPAGHKSHGGILVHEGWKVSVSDVRVERTFGHNICLRYSYNIDVTNNICRDSFSGIFFSRSHKCIVANNIVQKGGRFGIELNTGNHDLIIENNDVSGFSTLAGLYLYGANNCIYRNNLLHSNKYGADISPGANGNVIENNVFRNNGKYGIWIRGQYYSGSHIIRKNLIYSNGKGGIVTSFRAKLKRPRTMTIESNIIASNGGDGIFNNVPDYTFVVKNNIIANNAGYGIRKTAGAITSSYNDIWENKAGRYSGISAGANDISADPLFADTSKADFHLKSKAGRWDAKLGKWVNDKVQSPCIDAGDPESGYKNEPKPNGGRINMGAYGNTYEASRSRRLGRSPPKADKLRGVPPSQSKKVGLRPSLLLIKNHSSAGGSPKYKENDKDLIYKAKQGDKLDFSVTGSGNEASSYRWKVMKGSKVLTTFTKGSAFTWAVPSEKSTWEIYVAAANSKGRDYLSWSITTSGLKAVKPGESIQKAIDSLPPEGGIVELAAGIWTIDSTLKIVGSNVTLRGAGKDKTVIKGAKSMLLLLVRGPKATFPKPYGQRTYPKPPDPMFIEEVMIEDLALTGVKVGKRPAGYNSHTGIYVHEGWKVRVNDVRVERTGGSSIRANYSYNIDVTDNIFRDSSSGICFGRSHKCTIANNTVHKGRRFGIEMKTGSRDFIIENNDVSGFTTLAGLYLYSGANYCIYRNNLLHSNKYGADISPGANGNVIENNVFRNNGKYGIWIRGQYYSGSHIIRKNLIYSNGKGGIVTSFRAKLKRPRTMTIESNIIASNGGDGIFNNVPDYTFVVKNNIIANNAGYGIRKTAGAITSSYNDIWENKAGRYSGISAGANDISADPLFADTSKAEFHLKSKAGRWDAKLGKWVNDKVQSPCIDAGDPEREYKNEPKPNGGRINMGAYGNTHEASRSAGNRGR